MRRSHWVRRGAAAALAVGMIATGIGALPSAVAAPPASGMGWVTHDERLEVGDDAMPWRAIVVDGDDVQRHDSGAPHNVFGGFGSVSCNNTGKLLLDYKEENPEAYWRIMRLLFDPVEGAGLRHIKVELGSDSNTSSGAEPATMRSADEPANVLRGAGFHFIADALQVNPDIEVEALRWGEPSWTGNDWERRYRWYKETIDAAWDVYGIRFDWMSPSQNEVRGSANQDEELRWTVQFAEWLERDAQRDDARYDYSTIKIVALDSYREGDTVAGKILGNIAGIIPGDLVRDIGGETAGGIAGGILGNPDALEQVDALGYHYDIVGGPNVTRLNQEHGKPVLYSEGVAPMIDPQYRINAEPERGGIGGAFGAVDIADRFINAYRWSGAGDHPAHMTTFLFQPAVGAMYEGTQYSPKHLIRASDPWSGYWEGDVGIVTVRHFHQFIDHGWEYIEGATGGDGTKGDGGTNVDSSTQTVMTARTPAGAAGEPHFTQVHANNTSNARFFEVKVADLGQPGRPLHAWQTRGPDAGQSYDANYFQNIGHYAPVRTEDIDGVAHDVYRIRVEPYSILTLSTLPQGVDGTTQEYQPGQYAPSSPDTVLPLPYHDDFEYDDYPTEVIGGEEMGYVERRGGAPRYTADQDGAFEVVGSAGDNVLRQQIHAHNRGYTWNVWGDGSQDQLQTAAPSTVLGDHRWANYVATIDFRLDPVDRDGSLPNFAGLGVRQTHARGGDQATYAVRVHEDGRWELRKLDTVVDSGALDGFDASTWHTLSVEARETSITPTLDGVPLTHYVDQSASPVLSGRIALVTGFYNTQYDDLAVTPIAGHAWESEKLDDADTRVTYPSGARFLQVGFAHFNRTQHALTAGQSMTLTFTGNGLNLFGASGGATVEVQIDDRSLGSEQVGDSGTRQAIYWLRGLPDGQHTITVRVTAGTLTLDGVDVLSGGTAATGGG